MIPVPSANIVYSGLLPDVTVKEFNGVKRHAYTELGSHFWRTNLPRRFTWAGARFLGFERRSRNYIAKKKKQKGHTRPNVFSGTSERLATTIQDIRTTATSQRTRVRIVLHARGLNLYNPKSKVRPGQEVRRIVQREVPPLVNVLRKNVREGFKQVPFNPRRDRLY